MRHSYLVSCAASLYYGTASITLTLLNKNLFAREGFEHAPVLLFSQCFCTIFSFVVLSALGYTDSKSLISSISLRRNFLVPFVLLSLSYFLMVLMSLLSIQFMSLVMYNTMRRVSIVFVLAAEVFSSQNAVPRHHIFPICVMSAGALFAGKFDQVFSTTGYACVFVANLCTAIYLTNMRVVKAELNCSSFSVQFLDACVTALLLTIVPGFWRGMCNTILRIPKDPRFAVFFALCSCMGVILNHSVYVCTNINSPLSQQVTSQLKDVVLLFASYTLFDRFSVNLRSGCGAILSLAGAVGYGATKWRSHQTAK